MTEQSNIYDRISATSKSVQSSKSRLLIFLLSLIPLGLHNYYLGYYIKAITQTGVAILLFLFTPPIFFIIFFSLYIAYLTSEGLTYLLWYKVKDGYDFPLYDKNHPKLPNKDKAILLAFLLPFGLHNFYLGNFKRAYFEWGFIAFIIAHYILFLFIPLFIFLGPIYLIVIFISWIEGGWMLYKKKH